VRFERLARGHVVAAIAALVLLLVMAMDWYGSQEADFAHQVSSGANTSGSQAGEAGRALKQDADSVIARDEKNAWQTTGGVDRLLLVLLLLSVFLPLAAAAHRAAGRRAPPPWTPSAIAALVAAAAAVLVAYRILNEPGDDARTTIKLGAPIGLVMLTIIGMGAAQAFQGEADWAQLRRTATGSQPDTSDAEPEPSNTPP
jgi:hypothetical protein